LVNDTVLKIPLLSKQRAQFRAMLFYTGDPTADIKFAFTVPSGATLRWAPVGGARITGGDAWQQQDVITGGAVPISFGSSANDRVVELVGHVETAGTAGDLQLQWAQGEAVAADTKVLEGSYIEIIK
jgi:hypothetical protein